MSLKLRNVYFGVHSLGKATRFFPDVEDVYDHVLSSIVFVLLLTLSRY